MGRKPLEQNARKVNTKIRIRQELKDEAKKLDINFSQLMEKALLAEIKKLK